MSSNISISCGVFHTPPIDSTLRTSIVSFNLMWCILMIRSLECTRTFSTAIPGVDLAIWIYHNYFRPHMGLDGKIPAEVCGIEIKGDNKGITIIQNASKK